MKKILNYLALAVLLAINFQGFSQGTEKKLDPFSRITASPKINLILQKGNEESIRLTYSNINPAKINVIVEGGKLHLYLDQARILDKRVRTHDDYHSKASIYRDVQVTAYVTYVHLKSLEVRGDQEVACTGLLENESFKLKVYGQAEVTIDSLKTRKFKTVAYGENKIKIKGGSTGHQRYRLYGVNKIDTQNMLSHSISTSIYGEGRLSVNASDEVRINAFGEPKVNISGTSFINKGIIVGRADIRMMN